MAREGFVLDARCPMCLNIGIAFSVDLLSLLSPGIFASGNQIWIR
jgi:hypothetical protein